MIESRHDSLPKTNINSDAMQIHFRAKYQNPLTHTPGTRLTLNLNKQRRPKMKLLNLLLILSVAHKIALFAPRDFGFLFLFWSGSPFLLLCASKLFITELCKRKMSDKNNIGQHRNVIVLKRVESGESLTKTKTHGLCVFPMRRHFISLCHGNAQ